eukprot:376171-Alexandrium_andersonii.AAC.1
MGIDRRNVCSHAPPPPQPKAAPPARIKTALRLSGPHAVVYEFSEFVAVLAALLAEKAFVGGTPVAARRVL